MAKQTKSRRFTDGQRVRLVLIKEDREPGDRFLAHHLNYHGMIGYVTDVEHSRSDTESWRYEVLISKIGLRISLSEDCLESAEPGRPDL